MVTMRGSTQTIMKVYQRVYINENPEQLETGLLTVSHTGNVFVASHSFSEVTHTTHNEAGNKIWRNSIRDNTKTCMASSI